MRSTDTTRFLCLFAVVGMLAPPAFAAATDAPVKSAKAKKQRTLLAANDDISPPVDVPVSAPFTGPANSRPLPPPAPVPDLPGESTATAGETPGVDINNIENLANAVVSSASKREQRLKDVPMTVSWIPAEELEGTGQFTLCDAIQYFPGMECRRGAMRKAAVSAFGLGSNFLSNRLLLLKDGRPETDPWTGIFYPDETLPLTNIKQIEVIRGAGSSLYGSNAFAGVINIIQRTPDDLVKEGQTFGADLRLLAGQDTTYRAHATVAAKAGIVSGLVNYYGQTSAGPNLLNVPQLGVVDTQEWSHVNQISGQLNVGALRGDIDYTNSTLGRPGGVAISDVGNCGRCHYTPYDKEHVENLNAKLQGDVKVNEWLRLYGEGYALFKRRIVSLEQFPLNEAPDCSNIDPTQTPPGTCSLGKRRRIGGEGRALITTGGLALTLGGDIKRDSVNNQNTLPGLTSFDTQETIYGAFADGEYRISANLIVGAGLRYDYYQIPLTVWHSPSSQLSPRASIVFHATPELTLRTNYGRAFRAPTFAELAINQQMYAATLLGNPDLKAETLDSFEAAVDYWPFGGAVRLTGLGFYKRAYNFINQVFQGGSTSQFQNIGDAQIIGFDAEAAAKVPKLNSSFDLAYQYLNAVALPPGGGQPGTLDYAPQNRLFFRGHTNFGAAFADLYFLYVDQRQDPAQTIAPDGTKSGHLMLPAYFVANARVGAHVYEGLTLSLLGENIFNAQYEEMHGFPQPGIRLFGELKYVY